MEKEMIRISFVVLVGLVVASLAMPLSAQTALGTLRGIVVDQQSGALPGVSVTARQVDTNTSESVVTGAAGQYFLPNLRPGKYELTAELQGFAPSKQELELRVGQDLTVNLLLRVGGVSESIQVVAKSVAVETQSPLATVITNKQIDDLPTI